MATTEEKFQIFREISSNTVQFLINSLLTNVNMYFTKLFDADWLTNTDIVTNICNIYNEKFEVLDRMERATYRNVLYQIKTKSLVQYLTSMMRRKLQLASDEDRISAAKLISDEADVFTEFFDAMDEEENPDLKVSFDVLKHIGNVISSTSDMITFELMTLTRYFRL